MPSTAPHPALPRLTILTLAVACGAGVANVYLPQAISPLIASGLRVTPGSAALAATASQLGYAAGIFLLVPLGDRVQPRRLIVTLLVLTAVALLAASAAPSLAWLLAASAAVGTTTVVPQIILPTAAGLVPPERRGAVTGTLLSGLIGGILLARTFSATLSTSFGWRAPYVVAGSLALVLAAALAVAVPATEPQTGLGYPELLRAPLKLLRTEPDLRRSCFYQATVFAGFSAAWTAIALLLTGPVYGLGAQAVGLIALVGAGSMLCTPAAGRRIDRSGPDPVNLACMLAAILAAVVLAGGVLGGVAGLAALAAGILLLDVAMQSGQVANQTRIFALNPAARSRLNTAYMTCAFLGSSAGSWLGVRAYASLRWPGVCAVVALTAGLALARHTGHLIRTRPRSLAVAAEPALDSAGVASAALITPLDR